MPSRRVAAELNAGTYFLTLTVQRWYYLFDRHNRWQILSDSIRYCQDNKGLELNGYVFMLNHIHLIATSPDMAGFLRDFKRFTSGQFRRNLEATEPNVLKLFVDAQLGKAQSIGRNSASVLRRMTMLHRRKKSFVAVMSFVHVRHSA
jgi:putative transposase